MAIVTGFAEQAPLEVTFSASLQGRGCISGDGDKAGTVKLTADAGSAPQLAILWMAFTEQELEVTIKRKM